MVAIQTDTPKPLGASSAKYGACEVCHQHVSDVHILRLTTAPMDHLFGHKACLEGAKA